MSNIWFHLVVRRDTAPHCRKCATQSEWEKSWGPWWLPLDQSSTWMESGQWEFYQWKSMKMAFKPKPNVAMETYMWSCCIIWWETNFSLTPAPSVSLLTYCIYTNIDIILFWKIWIILHFRFVLVFVIVKLHFSCVRVFIFTCIQ